MKEFCFAFLVLLGAQTVPAQESTPAPAAVSEHELVPALTLITNGPGSIFIFQDGHLLPHGRTPAVGHRIELLALPDKGFVLSNWNPVNVYTLGSTIIDNLTDPPTTNTQTSTVLSPVSAFTKSPWIRFKLESPTVEYDANEMFLARALGWEANFVPIKKKTSAVKKG